MRRGPGPRSLVCGPRIALAAVVVGVVLSFAVAWWLGPPVAILVAAGGWFLGVGPRLRAAEERVAAMLGPTRPADPRAEARLLNLVEGLAPGRGWRVRRC